VKITFKLNSVAYNVNSLSLTDSMLFVQVTLSNYFSRKDDSAP